MGYSSLSVHYPHFEDKKYQSSEKLSELLKVTQQLMTKLRLEISWLKSGF